MSMNGTSTKQVAKVQKFANQVSTKLSGEWKNIYRCLVQSDSAQRGSISIAMFNKICSQFNVFLSNEELRKLSIMSYSEDQSFDLSVISAAGF